jgi:flagellar protein FliO/FliZ
MNQSPDLIATAVKMFLVLGILLGGLIVSLYLVKKLTGRKGSQSKGRLIRVLANSYVGVKKSISLVEVPGAVLVLGITSDRINLLAKIEDADTLQGLTTPENEPMRWSFSDHIQKMSLRYKKEKN